MYFRYEGAGRPPRRLRRPRTSRTRKSTSSRSQGPKESTRESAQGWGQVRAGRDLNPQPGLSRLFSADDLGEIRPYRWDLS